MQNEKKGNRIMEFILKHRKTFTIVFLIIGCLGVYIPKAFILGNSEDSTKSVEVIYYLSQIVSAIFVITGVVIAGWQYYLTSKAELLKLRLEKVQKSVELTQFYKKNILQKYSAIKYVYKEIGVIDIIHKIRTDDMKEFTAYELEHLLPKKDIKELKKKEKSGAFVKKILEANIIYNLKLHIIDKVVLDDKGDEQHVIDPRPILRGFFSGLLYDVLNNMESFAMYFTHEAADDTVVYQSLHHTYLEMVQVFYYHISVLNDMKNGAYYTNVIELYRKWYEKSKQDKQQKSIKVEGTTVEDIDS